MQADGLRTTMLGRVWRLWGEAELYMGEVWAIAVPKGAAARMCCRGWWWLSGGGMRCRQVEQCVADAWFSHSLHVIEGLARATSGFPRRRVL